MSLGAIGALSGTNLFRLAVVEERAVTSDDEENLGIGFVRVQSDAGTGNKYAVHNLAGTVVEHLYRELLLAAFEVRQQFDVHIRKVYNHTFVFQNRPQSYCFFLTYANIFTTIFTF